MVSLVFICSLSLHLHLDRCQYYNRGQACAHTNVEANAGRSPQRADILSGNKVREIKSETDEVIFERARRGKSNISCASEHKIVR